MIQLSTASALLVLVHADLPLSAAEKNRINDAFDGDEKTGGEIVEHLAYDAEFHRAMLKGADTDAGEWSRSSQRFRKNRPRLQRMMQHAKKNKHAFASTKRSVHTADVVEDESLNDSSRALDANGKVDTGVITASPSFSGRKMSKTVLEKPPDNPFDARNLQLEEEYCPPGCPQLVCDCYDYVEEDYFVCSQAKVDSCADGSYTESCNSADFDPSYAAYAQFYCAKYTCHIENGLLEETYNSSDGLCDQSKLPCAQCECEISRAVCDAFQPLGCPGAFSDTYFCDYVDGYCSIAQCCEDGGGPAGCVEGYEGAGVAVAPTLQVGAPVAAPTLVEAPVMAPSVAEAPVMTPSSAEAPIMIPTSAEAPVMAPSEAEASITTPTIAASEPTVAGPEPTGPEPTVVASEPTVAVPEPTAAVPEPTVAATEPTEAAPVAAPVAERRTAEPTAAVVAPTVGSSTSAAGTTVLGCALVSAVINLFILY